MPIFQYNSYDVGAPSLSGSVGSMITVLTACLSTGYNQVNVTSINRTGGVATVVTAAPHGFDAAAFDYVRIAGANQADYNGTFLVTGVIDATTFTYAVANAPATPATGTITSIRAPAGFSVPYTGTNKAVYRSDDVSGRRNYVRVLDDGSASGSAAECTIRSYQVMTTVDAGTDAYPSVADAPSGYWFRKSATSSTQVRPWYIISDGKSAYIIVAPSATTSYMTLTDQTSTLGFGDMAGAAATDVHASFLGSGRVANTSINIVSLLGPTVGTYTAPATFATAAVSSPHNWLGSTPTTFGGVFADGVQTTVGSPASLSYPNTDGAIYTGPLACLVPAPNQIRGRLPGALYNLHGRVFGQYEVIAGGGAYAGRWLKYITVTNAGTFGGVFFDITGPW